MELDQPELEGQLLLNGARNCDNAGSRCVTVTGDYHIVHGPQYTSVDLLVTAVYNHEETWGSHTPRHHGFFRAVERFFTVYKQNSYTCNQPFCLNRVIGRRYYLNGFKYNYDLYFF